MLEYSFYNRRQKCQKIKKGKNVFNIFIEYNINIYVCVIDKCKNN